MTPAEIAAALGVPSPDELAEELGFPVAPAAQPEPCLVLDFRGAAGSGLEGSESRWARFAKPPIPELRKPLAIDGVTGLRLEDEGV